MALRIDSDCVNCDVCESACPNQAISFGGDIYRIDPLLCTECVGHHDQPQCVALCPVDCIGVDPLHQESPAELMDKYRSLR